MNTLTDILWGKKAKLFYLLFTAAILLFAFLGTRDLWTQEHRWADIVSGMFYRHDFFHPYLNDVSYYDKPLLSYWFIVAVSYITGQLSTWDLRLPSALAGLLAIWSIYRLGTKLKDKQLGLLSGWLLLTCFYFIFWARTSSADMLNMAGSLFAVTWYFEKKDQPGFFNYSIFFVIIALTSLCKGLGGAIVPVLAILPHILQNGEWKKHVRLNFLFAVIPAALIYYFPFWASAHFGGESYVQDGLDLVIRENIVRYFKPFDHKGPIYTYFIYLPIYLLPWAVFFIPALFSLKSRWKNLSSHSKWIVWAVFILFVFFTLSGSRRNYYVLPIVPFAILMTADWITENVQRGIWAARLTVVAIFTFFIAFNVVQPLYYAKTGVRKFATALKFEASKIQPWKKWEFVMLDPESKTRFYLQLSPQVKNLSGLRNQKGQNLLNIWPELRNKNPNIIFISRRMYEQQLKALLPDYQVVSINTGSNKVFDMKNNNMPIAFIPKHFLS